MSGGSHYSYYGDEEEDFTHPLSPPRPAAEFGTTLLGPAWLDFFHGSGPISLNRGNQGRKYAREGLVAPLQLRPGIITAAVQLRRALSYQVKITCSPFSTEGFNNLATWLTTKNVPFSEWAKANATTALSTDLQECLGFCFGSGDIALSCTCPDAALPCKHLAAVAYTFAGMLDDNSSTLFIIRGKLQEMSRFEMKLNKERKNRERLALLNFGTVAASAVLQKLTHPAEEFPSIPALTAAPGRAAVRSLGEVPNEYGEIQGWQILAQGATDKAFGIVQGDPFTLKEDERMDLARLIAGQFTEADEAFWYKRFP